MKKTHGNLTEEGQERIEELLAKSGMLSEGK